jgi:hypothetical protein
MLRTTLVGAAIALLMAGAASAQLSTFLDGRSETQEAGPYIPSETNAGQILYQQLPDGSGGGVFADGAPGQFYNQRVADNFPHIGGPINGVCWWGGSENFIFPGLNNFSGFSVQFFADGGGLPGPAVSALMVFPTAATNPTPTGNILFGGGIEYYQCVKFNPIDLGLGNYWVSMGGIAISPGDDAYAWDFSLQGDNRFAFTDPQWASPWLAAVGFGDLAFQIQPEPATLSLLGLGALFLRRRGK